ncbi:hypothetical protein BGW42_000391 [Actinomortierella wolfii]|nr:hypothetical protein BGW42_000391 [Actinomortierella wolfii]
MDVPLRKPDVWNMKDAEEYEELRNDPINYLHDNATLSQSAALERLRQDAINFLERSLELEPSNDEFLQALVDLRLEFLDYRNFGRSQISKITPELQEAIVDTKAYLRKHLLRHPSLKALHILSSLEAIVGSKEERIMILQEILEQDPGASSERVVQPLVQYYWQQLTPDEAELVAEIERTNDDNDGDGSHRDDHGSSRDDGGSDHPIRHNMTYEEENEEIAHFHNLLEEYGLDDPSAPYLLDVVENLAFLGRDLNMGAFEGPDREYEFSDETGEGVYETKRRLFAWPGRMKMPDTDDEEEEVEEKNQEVAEAADEQVEKQKEWKEKKMQHQQRRKKERPLSMDDILGLPQFKSTGMERTLTGGTMVEQIQLHQLLLPTKSGHNSEEDEDDDEDPELLTPGTDIGTVRIIQKLDRHQPPVELFRPILELLLRRAEFGVLTAWEENELTPNTTGATVEDSFEAEEKRQMPHDTYVF